MSRRLVAIDGLSKKGDKNDRAGVPDLLKVNLVYCVGRATGPAKRFVDKPLSNK